MRRFPASRDMGKRRIGRAQAGSLAVHQSRKRIRTASARRVWGCMHAHASPPGHSSSGSWPGTAWAVPAGPAGGARRARALPCRRAIWTGAARRESLERGLALATAAVAADERDAVAHFAAFCTLGRLVQLRGISVLRPFEALRALGELDIAVRLAPDDPDVLAAKGATLLRLPRLLGGDPREGRMWLRRALARDPHHCAASAYLRRRNRLGTTICGCRATARRLGWVAGAPATSAPIRPA